MDRQLLAFVAFFLLASNLIVGIWAHRDAGVSETELRTYRTWLVPAIVASLAAAALANAPALLAESYGLRIVLTLGGIALGAAGLLRVIPIWRSSAAQPGRTASRAHAASSAPPSRLAIERRDPDPAKERPTRAEAQPRPEPDARRATARETAPDASVRASNRSGALTRVTGAYHADMAPGGTRIMSGEERPPQRIGWLVPLSGQRAGEALTLGDGHRIGRDAAKCNHVVDDMTVSGLHARIEVAREGIRILDQGSTNGTRVDGKKIVEHLLRDGEQVQLGSLELQYFEERGRAE